MLRKKNRFLETIDKKMQAIKKIQKKIESYSESYFESYYGFFDPKLNKIGQERKNKNPVFSGIIENTGLKLYAGSGT